MVQSSQSQVYLLPFSDGKSTGYEAGNFLLEVCYIKENVSELVGRNSGGCLSNILK